VGQAGSRRYCSLAWPMCISDVVDSQCASRLAAVISSIIFDLDIVFSAITTTFLVVDQLNTCT